jgi:pSer/pThr/pTyr-binding forkhead associated (FHA) protein
MMKKIMIVMMVFIGMLYANNVTLLDLAKKNNEWKAEVVISPPVTVDRVIVNSDKNTSEGDFKTDLPTSVFFLIDTSIPMKQAYKKGIQPLLFDMGKVRDPKERWTVAYFDTDMHIVFDDTHNQLRELPEILKSIPVKGQRTELWRNTQDAIKELIKMPGQRKVLVLLSDGDAEDTSAYTREDVIKMANDAHIRIASIAYRDTMGTQNLRKIAEETHGIFWKADKFTHQLPLDFHREMVKFIRSQGIVTIPSSLLHPTKSGHQDLQVVFEHGTQKSMLDITVDTEKIVPPTPPKVQKQVPVHPKVVKSDFQLFLEKYKLFLAVGGVLLLMIILYFLLRKKPEEEIEEEIDEGTTIIQMPSEPQEESTVIAPSEPIAYFEAFDGSQHTVFQVPASIGKSSTNDVVIDRQYVSRRHAVLTHKNGYFYIADDNSSNGVIINGKKIKVPTKIESGARVGFGPYETVFRVVVNGQTVEPQKMQQTDTEKTRLNQ